MNDFTPVKTVYIPFNTQEADGTPITLAGTPAISIYKRGSTTESTAGVSLTVDYDSRTGYHVVAIDTSADGTFYAAGNDFDAVITTGTVDSISVVGKRVGSFSLSNRSHLRPTTADRTLTIESDGMVHADLKEFKGSVPADLADTDKLPASVQHVANNAITAAATAADFAAELAALIETYIVNEGDATAVLQAVADRIAADWVAGDASPLAIIAALKADAQWSNLATMAAELAKVPKSDSNVTWNPTAAAQVKTQADTALTDIHLDHLLATDYDPASKPGVATALLNELIESDGGVSRYTANALEQGPSGGGGGGGEVDLTDEAIALIAAQVRGVRAAAGTHPYNGTARTLVRGDDYVDDFPIPWTLSNADGVADLTGLTMLLRLVIDRPTATRQSADSEPASIDVPTGSVRSGSVEWENLGAELPLGTGEYRFVLQLGGDQEVTLLNGPLTLI